MKSKSKKIYSTSLKGLDKYMALLKNSGSEIDKSQLSDAKSDTYDYAENYATFYASDHRVVWLKLNMNE
jgi:hypothetical protein